MVAAGLEMSNNVFDRGKTLPDELKEPRIEFGSEMASFLHENDPGCLRCRGTKPAILKAADGHTNPGR